MRIFAALFLIILLAAAAVMYLQQRSATTSLEAVASAAADLREGGVAGRTFDHELASRMAASMRDLLATPDDLANHTNELRTLTATAASWAAAAPAPSIELRAAVALRSAAGELRTYALQPSNRHLHAAELHLDTAEAALAGEPIPNDPTGALRDQIDNLQRSHQEQLQEIDEALAE
jgi:hypothetical protein